MFISKFVSLLATGGVVVLHLPPLNNLVKVNVCMMDAGKPDASVGSIGREHSVMTVSDLAYKYLKIQEDHRSPPIPSLSWHLI